MHGEAGSPHVWSLFTMGHCITRLFWPQSTCVKPGAVPKYMTADMTRKPVVWLQPPHPPNHPLPPLPNHMLPASSVLFSLLTYRTNHQFLQHEKAASSTNANITGCPKTKPKRSVPNIAGDERALLSWSSSTLMGRGQSSEARRFPHSARSRHLRRRAMVSDVTCTCQIGLASAKAHQRQGKGRGRSRLGASCIQFWISCVFRGRCKPGRQNKSRCLSPFPDPFASLSKHRWVVVCFFGF